MSYMKLSVRPTRLSSPELSFTQVQTGKIIEMKGLSAMNGRPSHSFVYVQWYRIPFNWTPFAHMTSLSYIVMQPMHWTLHSQQSWFTAREILNPIAHMGSSHWDKHWADHWHCVQVEWMIETETKTSLRKKKSYLVERKKQYSLNRENRTTLSRGYGVNDQ